jgi:hypothetical protein
LSTKIWLEELGKQLICQQHIDVQLVIEAFSGLLIAERRETATSMQF